MPAPLPPVHQATSTPAPIRIDALGCGHRPFRLRSLAVLSFAALGVGCQESGDERPQSFRSAPAGLVVHYDFDELSSAPDNGDVITNLAPSYAGSYNGVLVEPGAQPTRLERAEAGGEGNYALVLNNDGAASTADLGWLRVLPGLHNPGSGLPFEKVPGVPLEGTISARVRLTHKAVTNTICYGCGPLYMWRAGSGSKPYGRMKATPENVANAWSPESSPAPDDQLPYEEWVYVTVVYREGTAATAGQRGYVRFYKDCHDVTLDLEPSSWDDNDGNPENNDGILKFLSVMGGLGNQSLIGYGTPGVSAFDGAIDELKIWNRALSEAEVVASLCPLADLDADDDGVADSEDNCPNTLNPGVDHDNNPNTPPKQVDDADEDGVGDVCDACPEVHGGDNSDGCPHACEVPACNDLELWYTFDDPGDFVEDLAPYGVARNDGVKLPGLGGLSTIDAPGYAGNRALTFDNQTIPVDANNNPLPTEVAYVRSSPRLHSLEHDAPFAGAEGITVSARVKIDTESVENNALCIGCGPAYTLYAGVGAAPRGRLRSFPLNGNTWSPYSSSAADDLIPDDEWATVTMVLRPGTEDAEGKRGSLRYYVNCRDVTVDPEPPAGTVLTYQDYLAPTGDQTLIGYGGNNADYAFEGAMDDLKVWRTALNSQEVGQLCDGSPGSISAVWANTGEDKVTRDELRASGGLDVNNSVWDGAKVALSGARNETVAFNLVLEAGAGSVADVSVAFDTLTHQNGIDAITSVAPPLVAGEADFFDWTERNIELFFVRYLKIEGLSLLAYENYYDERHVPKRLRRPIPNPLLPYVGEGDWEDRPDHDKYYPEIAVPLELEEGFEIQGKTNQSVWADIYVPRNAVPGLYTGTVTITQPGQLPEQINVPVELRVHGFALPETTGAKTMVWLESNDIAERYLGKRWPEGNDPDATLLRGIIDRHYQMAHRHRISLIGYGHADVWRDSADAPIWDKPRDPMIPRLDGSLFTPEMGYQGPGVGVGVGVYSIATYGGWGSWLSDVGQQGLTDEQKMWRHTDAWENWFRRFSYPWAPVYPERMGDAWQAYLSPDPDDPQESLFTCSDDDFADLTCAQRIANVRGTERFLYLIDESTDHEQINTWAGWVNANPDDPNDPDDDFGHELMTLATLSAAKYAAWVNDPDHDRDHELDIPTSPANFGITDQWQTAVDALRSDPGRRMFVYNGRRPASGSFATEDDGVALRTLPWIQNKLGIDRWFFWASTYYYSYQFNWPASQTNLFNEAQTFGGVTGDAWPPHDGDGGTNHGNGDGVLFYPGTDLVFPADSYWINGPIASLRLKHWRRGLQDYEYIELARAVPGAAADVNAIVAAMVPEVLWEMGVTSLDDPTYLRSDITWSTDPNLWEHARTCLAAIITDYPAYQATPHYLSSLGTGGCELICDDGVHNGQETDVDCGGMICGACGNGDACSTSQDCESSVCTAGVCAVASCDDGVRNQGETQPDCGGPACPNCDGEGCGAGSECLSGVCVGGVCQAPSCEDGAKNQDETDIDCGGSSCGPCDVGASCVGPSDCGSGICTQGHCLAPSCDDGIKNQGETQVDCGGEQCPNCDGESCTDGEDCLSSVCDSGYCGVPTCDDGLKNGGEGDVDCGGGSCPLCTDNKTCKVSADCESKRCLSGTCWPPICGDWIQNGSETGFDCGGSCPGCAGDPCDANADCRSKVCTDGVCQLESCNDGVGWQPYVVTEPDVDCGWVCYQSFGGERCANSKHCWDDYQCQSFRCEGQACLPCSVDADCSGDFNTCVDGMCTTS